MTTWAEQHAPKPGDLIYPRDPDDGTVYTGRAWVVLENNGPVPAEKLAESMPWATYWDVVVQCDGRCGELGYSDGCTAPSPHHYWLLSAEDFVLVSQLPEFGVTR